MKEYRRRAVAADRARSGKFLDYRAARTFRRTDRGKKLPAGTAGLRRRYLDDGQEVNLFYFPKNGRMLVLPGYGEYEREIFTLTIPFYYEK